MLRRAILSMDELVELKDRGVTLERQLSRYKLWMFTIQGYRGLEYVKGALFAGNCIVVQAPNFETALRLAREGLEYTIELALQWLMGQDRDDPLASPIAEAFGRNAGDPERQAYVDPRLDALLRHKLGGEPWRG